MKHMKKSILILGMVFGMVNGVGAETYRDVVVGDNPISYWRLGESGLVNGGSQMVDEMGNNHGVYYSYPNNGSTGGSVSGVEGAIHGDGNTAIEFGKIQSANPAAYTYGGAVVIPDAGEEADDFTFVGGTQSFSIEAWWKRDVDDVVTMGGFISIFSKANIANGKGYALTLGGFGEADGKTTFTELRLTAYGAGGGHIKSTSDIEYEVGEWYHIVATYQASGLVKLYLNGEEVASANSFGIPTTSEMPAMIGAIGNTSMSNVPKIYAPFPGVIDEVAVYNYALSGEQVATHFNAAAIPEPGLTVLLGLAGLLCAGRRRS